MLQKSLTRSPKIKPIERPKSLGEIATHSIRQAIINGQYGLGEALSENSLTESLGISKTPIREALMLLKHEGLVSVVPQKGTFVFTMSVSDVIQLGHYRLALECTALDMAMQAHPEALLVALADYCDAMGAARKQEKLATYLRLDGQFHRTFLNYCDNRYLQDGYQSIAGKSAALRTHFSRHPSHMDKSMTEHLKLTQFLRNGKINEAKNVLKRHVTRGGRTYADGIEDIALASPELRRIRRPNRS